MLNLYKEVLTCSAANFKVSFNSWSLATSSSVNWAYSGPENLLLFGATAFSIISLEVQIHQILLDKKSITYLAISSRSSMIYRSFSLVLIGAISKTKLKAQQSLLKAF